MTRPIAIVAAIADNGVIGGGNRLLWRLKTDLRRFRDLTWGKPVIMGRKTFQSLGRPLPGRDNIVLTRDRGFAAPGVDAEGSFEEALVRAERCAAASGADALMVIGGAEVYALALPMAERLHLTLVHAAPDGDTAFPSFDRALYREAVRQEHGRGPDDEHPFTFVDLVRRPAAAAR